MRISGGLVGAVASVSAGLFLAAYAATEADMATAQASFGQFAAAALAAGVVGAAVKVHGVARTVGGRRIAIRTEPGHEVKIAAWHEGGHIALARAAGGRVTGAYIYPDGSGVTYVRMPRSATVVDEIAVCVAGEVAAGTSRGCGPDQADMEAALATLPADERSAAKRAGYGRARAVTGGFLFDGGVASAAERLLRDGRY